MNQQQKTREWLAWAAQVNANYHDGGMSEADAEAAAGPEPIKYQVEAERLCAMADISELIIKGKLDSFIEEFPHAAHRMKINSNQ